MATEGETNNERKASTEDAVPGYSSTPLLVGVVVSIILMIGALVGLGLAAQEPADRMWAFPQASIEVPNVADDRPVTLPHVAQFAGLATGFFGTAAICFYAYYVLKQPMGNQLMVEIAHSIKAGAKAFLFTEYIYLSVFVIVIFVLAGVGTGSSAGAWDGWCTAICYLIGAALSAAAGYTGMIIATEGNSRTSWAAYKSLSNGLQVAFRSGAVMGLSVVSFGIIGLSAVLFIPDNGIVSIAGFSAGASSVALFARVGGGIYTKAADVGADLVGKVEAEIPEDDPRNPATIADNVGDNVGDVAGMGSDLFESFVGSIAAAVILAARQNDLEDYADFAVAFPFWICAIGIIAAVVCTAYLRCNENSSMNDLLNSMRMNVVVSAVLIVLGVLATVLIYFYEYYTPSNACIPEDGEALGRNCFTIQAAIGMWGCVLIGLVAGIFIGWITEYFTSSEDPPTRSIAQAAEFGAGPVIIQGMGMGMLSTTVPLVLVVSTIISTYKITGFYGTAIAAVGMLSTLGVTMATDAYGPVADNAGGISEMAELPEFVRDRTDRLDALGNTTAATGKGFANGSAVLAALSLLAAFTYEVSSDEQPPQQALLDTKSPTPYNAFVISEWTICGLLIGAVLPFIFSACTMLAVGRSAQAMIVEVRRQFASIEGLREGRPGVKADFTKCVEISTKASIREMIFPALLSILAPLCVGLLMGLSALTGLLAGALATGYLLGVMMNNAGGAWDNAKKYIEAGNLKDVDGNVMGKKSEWHKAAVAGDTVGDPFKDTSGPSLNILIKLMTVFALVFTPVFKSSTKDPSALLNDGTYPGIGVTAGALIVLAALFYWNVRVDKNVREQARAKTMAAKAEERARHEGHRTGQGEAPIDTTVDVTPDPSNV